MAIIRQTHIVSYTARFIPPHSNRNEDLCLRYPSLSLPIHFALYFQYSFVTRRVCVIVLDGEIGTTQYHVGGNLQEITEQHGRKHRSNPPELHPFVYALPFLQHVGNLTDRIRNECRDKVVDLEQKTGTSVYGYGAQATSDILNQASGQRDIETLTRRAHICGANVAESHKYLRVHLRAVREFTQGYRSFQERYCKSFHAGADLAKYRTEAERVEGILQLELDTCKGRQMELENLGRRVDIQINMVSLKPIESGLLSDVNIDAVYYSWLVLPPKERAG